MMKNAEYWIKKLDLLPHPEGGYYKETYRSAELISAKNLPSRYHKDHCFCTAIYFLLNGHQYSAFHRIKSDELWHFHTGSPLRIYSIDKDGMLFEIKLGPHLERGEIFQAHLRQGCWFAAEVIDKEYYSLVSCTVAPGFEFDDFELANATELIAQFPRHKKLISRLCAG